MLINAKSLANAVAGSTLVFDGNGWVAAPPTPAASVGVTVQLYYNGVGRRRRDLWARRRIREPHP